MTTQTQTPAERIALIDRQIDATRWELHLRCPLIDTLSARSWQDAWDRNPTLRDRETDLFRQRGIAQQERDEAEHKAAMKTKRAQIRAYRKGAFDQAAA